MFDIGFWELALIGMISLVVLGPKRLPEAARSAGRWVGRLRGFINNVKKDLDQQLQADELAELRKLKEELTGARKTLEDSAQSFGSTLTSDAATAGESLLDAVNSAVSSDSPEGKTDKPAAKNSLTTDSADKKTVKRKSSSRKKKSTGVSPD
ncbi:MAG: Sec-independent protein translocase protein TatB [Gammaproteobacteria bacterium]|nr:Sec-independent protein translocase protein TatB [Gammaproteobacteria bacterium]